MEFYKKILCVSMLLIGLVGCGFGAGIDLNVATKPLNPEYGKLQPRVSADNCQYYTEENAPDPSTYTALAAYDIKETQTVITSRTARTMICYAHKRAVLNGADTIIVHEISEEKVPGVRRITPVVKVLAIRFKGELPPELKQ